MPLPQYDLPRALTALRKLLRDPDDLAQVFTIIESVAGMAPHRLVRGFRRTPSGKRLLRDRPDIVPLLADPVGLGALPEGTLGREYLDFVRSEGISAQGIREASLAGATYDTRAPADLRYVKERMRDTHDLWHAATGYKGDVAGELALLGFNLAQNWHTGIAAILAAGMLKGYSADVGPMIAQGYRRGRRAEYLPSQEWESLLPLPLTVVRARLGLGPPPVYTPVRTAELRARGVL
jgi:ubiquinone biosynthesis protein COQ4